MAQIGKKAIAFAKIVSLAQKLKIVRKTYLPTTLELFCAKNDSKKHT